MGPHFPSIKCVVFLNTIVPERESTMPRTHIFLLENGPKTPKNALNKKGNHGNQGEKFRIYLVWTVFQIINRSLHNSRSKISLKRSLFLSKMGKSKMVTNYLLLTGFIYHFGLYFNKFIIFYP